MDLQLTGKVVAVTGGSRGIGLATALRLAQEGAAVAICGRGTDDLARAHAHVEAQGARCLAYSCDLTQPGEAAGFIGAVVETFGRVDAVVCAAGGAPGPGDEREDWEATFRLTLFHAVEAARTAAALMTDGGAIVFITPICGDETVIAPWSHRAAKAALDRAAASLAQELAPQGVRVNALAPGATPAAAGGTSRSVEGSRRPAAFLDRDPQLGGLRAAAGIADVAAFLVSSRAGGVSGAVVRVEG